LDTSRHSEIVDSLFRNPDMETSFSRQSRVQSRMRLVHTCEAQYSVKLKEDEWDREIEKRI
jgi:hypothetical protein